MATASGLEGVPEIRRNPLHTTSRGTGELIMVCSAAPIVSCINIQK